MHFNYIVKKNGIIILRLIEYMNLVLNLNRIWNQTTMVKTIVLMSPCKTTSFSYKYKNKVNLCDNCNILLSLHSC